MAIGQGGDPEAALAVTNIGREIRMKAIAIAVAAIVLSGPAWAQGLPQGPALPTFFLPGTLSGNDATLAIKADGAGASTLVRNTTDNPVGLKTIPMFQTGTSQINGGAAGILFQIGAPSP